MLEIIGLVDCYAIVMVRVVATGSSNQKVPIRFEEFNESRLALVPSPQPCISPRRPLLAGAPTLGVSQVELGLGFILV